ncbi:MULTISPECIES: ADP-ribosylglycohydrolase family protein [Niastella]|uniref:ADP-ribosylglycohydrolase family protein n=1 Tax=Niastella soli TaxID=2821487 RepID=A0ABS3YNY4_9BACT|nr:ADP-ribosylglycohydrolase family protein [Niastella soli]MBO9199317.1 ADP-ribosylglycohydrolase family protein [Niastella soli]
MKPNPVHGALFGLAIGDALGVPVEMIKRDVLKKDPVQDFTNYKGPEGYKGHQQPVGTFSDDSSLTFCLAESLCNGYNLNDIAARFVQYFFEGYWTAGGVVFGVGKSTEDAITRLRDGVLPERSGNYDVNCTGNGSLMRILPLLFYLRAYPVGMRYHMTRQVASITHGSIQTILPCFYFLEFALEILNGSDRQTAYGNTAKTVSTFISNLEPGQQHMDVLTPLINEDITQRSEGSINSIHHAVHTIQAAMYCFMKTNSYTEAVLMAVNLGDDTDTTAAVTGGLAGLYYGFDAIPEKWIAQLKRSNEIKDLGDRLTKAMGL